MTIIDGKRLGFRGFPPADQPTNTSSRKNREPVGADSPLASGSKRIQTLNEFQRLAEFDRLQKLTS